MNLLLVMLGGFFGAIARFAAANLSKKLGFGTFPAGTAFVNGTGAFLLGLLLGAALPEPIQLLAGTGFLGAYTTFSTMHLEIRERAADGRRMAAYLYMAGSYLLGPVLAFFGLLLGSALK